ncbi:MAG: hypothetical protein AAGB19_09485 [Cyanobacteria bacterium P01_F01_bin.3]
MIEICDQDGDVVEVRYSLNDFVEAGMLSPGGIILPKHPLHAATLNQSLPPGWDSQFSGQNQGLFVCRPGSDLLEPVAETGLSDYLYGGEYEQRQLETTDNSLI